MLQIQAVSLNFRSLSFKMTVDTQVVSTIQPTGGLLKGRLMILAPATAPAAAKASPSGPPKPIHSLCTQPAHLPLPRLRSENRAEADRRPKPVPTLSPTAAPCCSVSAFPPMCRPALAARNTAAALAPAMRRKPSSKPSGWRQRPTKSLPLPEKP